MEIKMQDIKKKLYFTKVNILFNRALQHGKITRFDEEIFERMSNTIIACLPVSLYIKYSKHLLASGTCYDRSLYMFLALDDALLVRGDQKPLEYNYGEEHAGHGWIEIGDYVYDPSLMLKFDKDTYYALYGCSNVSTIDKETYLQQNKEFVERCVSHDLNDFKPNGKRRLELGILITLINALSPKFDDEQFTRDFNAYLASIEYDEKQIADERKKAVQRVLSGEVPMPSISGIKK